MTSSALVRKFQVLATRPSRVADVLREPRQMVVGSPLANKLGLQIVRAVKDRALWQLRRERVTDAVRAAYEEMEREGIVVIPDFFPASDHALLAEEFAASRTDPALTRTAFGTNFDSTTLFATDWPSRYPHTMRLVRDNDFLLDLASAVSRRRRTYKPHVFFFSVEKPDPDAPHVDLDNAQFAHPDRHYPFVKVFYYVNDVDEHNAPFCYARGTHKLSRERLAFEYEHSIKWAEGGRDGIDRRTEDQIHADEVLRELTERYVERERSVCEPITGKANTMIIVNNQGVHKRGPYSSTRPRHTISVDYKYLESPAQWMHPVLKHLYRDT